MKIKNSCYHPKDKVQIIKGYGGEEFGHCLDCKRSLAPLTMEVLSQRYEVEKKLVELFCDYHWWHNI
jgi:hypothetical protein